MTGNMVFIGELFKQGIVPVEIIHLCISDTLFKQESEEQLQGVCSLLFTVGYVLESEPLSRLKMDTYFLSLRKLAADAVRFSSRIRLISLLLIIYSNQVSDLLLPHNRFLLVDVIELRENKWRVPVKLDK